MTIDRNQLLALFSLDKLPFCDDGVDLAGRFMERAFDACEVNGEEDVLRTRNAMIRAHKDLVLHCALCPKCQAATPTESVTIN
jgi:hypothetical protein